MLNIVREILKAYWNNEFIAIIVYGAHGYGKSSYSTKGLAETRGVLDLIEEGYSWQTILEDSLKKTPTLFKPNYSIDYLDRYMKWHPKDVVDRLLEMMEREVVFVWDDAGFWLNALEWSHPWVRAVQKYMNVVRTDFGAIIFTTPDPTWVTKKIRSIPQALTVKIIKASSDPYQKYVRLARAYRWWKHPDMKRSGVHKIWEDRFSCLLPDDVFNWYVPKRKEYAVQAKLLMRDQLKTLKEGEVIPPEEVKI